MRRILPLLFLGVAIIPSIVFSQSSKPSRIYFFNIPSITPGETSALSGECDGDSSSPEITCQFTQVMVSYKIKPKDLPTESKKAVDLISKNNSEIIPEFKKYCEKFSKDASETKFDSKIINSSLAKQQAQEVTDLCSSLNLESIKAFLLKSIATDSKTCKISSFQNKPIRFKKVSANKWIANTGPEGICDVANITTMENDPQATHMWKWSQVRTHVDTKSELCQGLQVGTKIEFSSWGGDFAMLCETISFGM